MLLRFIYLHVQISRRCSNWVWTPTLDFCNRIKERTSSSEWCSQYLNGSTCQDPCSFPHSPGLFPWTDPVVPQKMAAENAFLDALQKQQMKLEDSGGLLAEVRLSIRVYAPTSLYPLQATKLLHHRPVLCLCRPTYTAITTLLSLTDQTLQHSLNQIHRKEIWIGKGI